MKNFIANIPVVLTVPFQILIKLLHKICMFGVASSSLLHVLLNTKTGKKLKELEVELKKAEALAKQISSNTKTQSSGSSKISANPKLKNIIDGEDNSGKKGPTFH